jgi:hypothetical protein
VQSGERAAEKINVLEGFEGLDVGSPDASLFSLQNRIQRFDRKLEEMHQPTLVRVAQDMGVRDA